MRNLTLLETPQENFTITTSDGPPMEAKKRARTVEDRLAELQAERLADEAAEILNPRDFDRHEYYLHVKNDAA
jgi:hypothetical protein